MSRTIRHRYIIFLLLLAGIAMLSLRCKPESKQQQQQAANQPTPYSFTSDLPPDAPQIDQPADNPATVEGVKLGRMLFYDPVLSVDSSISCNSCHKQENAFASNNTVEKGVGGLLGRRSSMSLCNLAFEKVGFFWDGRSPTIEDQVTHPVSDPREMNQSWTDVVMKLKRSKFYPDAFKAAFPGESISEETAAKALAQFVRTLISSHSKFDESRRGNVALSTQEQNGLHLFTTDPVWDNTGTLQYHGSDCGHCHNTLSNFQDPAGIYHDNGLDSVNDNSQFKDAGRGEVTHNPKDFGTFKVPTLRNIALTAPYMHDGRFKTLDEVLNHYNAGGKPSPNCDQFMARNQFAAHGGKLELSDKDKQDIIAFLKTLTDTTFTHDPRFSNPFKK